MSWARLSYLVHSFDVVHLVSTGHCAGALFIIFPSPPPSSHHISKNLISCFFFILRWLHYWNVIFIFGFYCKIDLIDVLFFSWSKKKWGNMKKTMKHSTQSEYMLVRQSLTHQKGIIIMIRQNGLNGNYIFFSWEATKKERTGGGGRRTNSASTNFSA